MLSQPQGPLSLERAKSMEEALKKQLRAIQQHEQGHGHVQGHGGQGQGGGTHGRARGGSSDGNGPVDQEANNSSSSRPLTGKRGKRGNKLARRLDIVVEEDSPTSSRNTSPPIIDSPISRPSPSPVHAHSRGSIGGSGGGSRTTPARRDMVARKSRSQKLNQSSSRSGVSPRRGYSALTASTTDADADADADADRGAASSDDDRAAPAPAAASSRERSSSDHRQRQQQKPRQRTPTRGGVLSRASVSSSSERQRTLGSTDRRLYAAAAAAAAADAAREREQSGGGNGVPGSPQGGGRGRSGGKRRKKRPQRGGGGGRQQLSRSPKGRSPRKAAAASGRGSGADLSVPASPKSGSSSDGNDSSGRSRSSGSGVLAPRVYLNGSPRPRLKNVLTNARQESGSDQSEIGSDDDLRKGVPRSRDGSSSSTGSRQGGDGTAAQQQQQTLVTDLSDEENLSHLDIKLESASTPPAGSAADGTETPEVGVLSRYYDATPTLSHDGDDDLAFRHSPMPSTAPPSEKEATEAAAAATKEEEHDGVADDDMKSRSRAADEETHDEDGDDDDDEGDVRGGDDDEDEDADFDDEEELLVGASRRRRDKSVSGMAAIHRRRLDSVGSRSGGEEDADGIDRALSPPLREDSPVINLSPESIARRFVASASVDDNSSLSGVGNGRKNSAATTASRASSGSGPHSPKSEKSLATVRSHLADNIADALMDIELNRDAHRSSALVSSPKSNKKKRSPKQQQQRQKKDHRSSYGSLSKSARISDPSDADASSDPASHRRSLSSGGDHRKENAASATRQRSRTSADPSDVAGPHRKGVGVGAKSARTVVHFDPSIDDNSGGKKGKPSRRSPAAPPLRKSLSARAAKAFAVVPLETAEDRSAVDGADGTRHERSTSTTAKFANSLRRGLMRAKDMVGDGGDDSKKKTSLEPVVEDGRRARKNSVKTFVSPLRRRRQKKSLEEANAADAEEATPDDAAAGGDSPKNGASDATEREQKREDVGNTEHEDDEGDDEDDDDEDVSDDDEDDVEAEQRRLNMQLDNILKLIEKLPPAERRIALTDVSQSEKLARAICRRLLDRSNPESANVVCRWLFEYYSNDDRVGDSMKLFVLQFVPAFVWVFMSRAEGSIPGVAAVLHGIYTDQRRRHQANRNPQPNPATSSRRPASATTPRPRVPSRGTTRVKHSHTNPRSDSGKTPTLLTSSSATHATVPARKSPRNASTPRAKIPSALVNSKSGASPEREGDAAAADFLATNSHSLPSIKATDDKALSSSAPPNVNANARHKVVRSQTSFTYSKARSREVNKSYGGLSETAGIGESLGLSSPRRSFTGGRLKSASKSSAGPGRNTIGKMNSFMSGEIPLMSALQDPADLFMHPPDLFPEVRVPSLGETSVYHVPDAEDSQAVHLTHGLLEDHLRAFTSGLTTDSRTEAKRKLDRDFPRLLVGKLSQQKLTIVRVCLALYIYHLSEMPTASQQQFCAVCGRLSSSGLTSSTRPFEVPAAIGDANVVPVDWSWDWNGLSTAHFSRARLKRHRGITEEELLAFEEQERELDNVRFVLSTEVLHQCVSGLTYCMSRSACRTIAELALYSIHERASQELDTSILFQTECLLNKHFEIL